MNKVPGVRIIFAHADHSSREPGPSSIDTVRSESSILESQRLATVSQEIGLLQACFIPSLQHYRVVTLVADKPKRLWSKKYVCN